ncbi:MAG: hypothetical protein GY838_10555 [bacterium]|nr:hypothetical protein [bacterium]
MYQYDIQPENQDSQQPARLTGWRLACLLLLGSAWGLTELVGGETVWLTAAALCGLAVARTLVNRPGSSTAVAAIAVLFKSVNTAPFICHLAGIALLGFAFDLAASLLWRDDRGPYVRAASTGVVGAFLSCLFFAAAMVWIFEYGYWADGGLARVGEHTLYSGGRGALAAVVVVPIGLWLGRRLSRRAAFHPRGALRTAVMACLAVWLLGPWAG